PSVAPLLVGLHDPSASATEEKTTHRRVLLSRIFSLRVRGIRRFRWLSWKLDADAGANALTMIGARTPPNRLPARSDSVHIQGDASGAQLQGSSSGARHARWGQLLGAPLEAEAREQLDHVQLARVVDPVEVDLAIGDLPEDLRARVEDLAARLL